MQHFRIGGQITGLEELIAKTNGGVMVEVGSAYGESAEIFAKKFDKVYCVDVWNGITAEREPHFDEVVKRNPNIIKRKGSSVQFLDEFADNSLDFVYIDANHTYESVKEDITNWKKKVKKGGFIGGHDFSYKFLGTIKAVHEIYDRPDWVFCDSSWLKKI